MKSYNAIDVMRFVAALLVVSIHTDPFLDLSPVFNYFWVSVLARLAVPFFFMTSGFFLAKKLESCATVRSKQDYIVSYAKRLLKLYILWSMIYLLFQALIWLVKGDGWAYWGEYIHEFIFEGSYYTLWYLPALIFASVFAYILFSFFKPEAVLVITFILYTIGTLLQSYFDLFQQKDLLSGYYSLFLTTRNGLFFGSFFVSAGMYVATVNHKRTSIRNLKLFIVSFLLLTVEAFNMIDSPFTKGSGMWFLLAPAVYFLFSYLKEVQLRNRPIYSLMRPISFIIYVAHGLFLLTIGVAFDMNSFLYWIIVTILSLIFASAMISLGNKYRNIRHFY